MNQRAYSTLEIKAATEDGGKRRFSGIASTPETDRMGDIVEPKGAEFKLPLPLLWQHDSRNPIGWITKARITDAGIEVDYDRPAILQHAAANEDWPMEEWIQENARAWPHGTFRYGRSEITAQHLHRQLAKALDGIDI